MFRKLQKVIVDLNSPSGGVFSGHVNSVELRITDGAIAIMPHEERYLNLTQTTQVTLRIGTEFRIFDLENATAALREGRLAILAERIREVEPEMGQQR